MRFFLLIASTILLGHVMAQPRQKPAFQPNQKLLATAADSNCYKITCEEADRAFRLGYYDDAAALYRAAKSCDDANQQLRQAMDRRIGESRRMAEAKLLSSEQRVRDAEERKRESEQLARLKDRGNLVAIASQRANDAQELLRRHYDRTLAYRLAYFANEYISPEGENNPNCLQSMYDAWYFNMARYNPGYEEFQVPFCYELDDKLGRNCQVRFVAVAPPEPGRSVQTTKGQYARRKQEYGGGGITTMLAVLSPQQHQLVRWNLSTFQPEPPEPVDGDVSSFEVSPDGRTLLFLAKNAVVFERDGQRRRFPMSTAVFGFSADGRMFYYVESQTRTLHLLQVDDLFPQRRPAVTQKVQSNLRVSGEDGQPGSNALPATLTYPLPPGLDFPESIAGTADDKIWFGYADSLYVFQLAGYAAEAWQHLGTLQLNLMGYAEYLQDARTVLLPATHHVVVAGGRYSLVYRIPPSDNLRRGASVAVTGAPIRNFPIAIRPDAGMLATFQPDWIAGQNNLLSIQRPLDSIDAFGAYLPIEEKYPGYLAAAFSPDSTWLAAVSDNGVLKLWALTKPPGEEIYHFPEADRSTAITPDGTGLVTLNAGTVTWWPLDRRGQSAVLTSSDSVMTLRGSSNNWISYVHGVDTLVIRHRTGAGTIAVPIAPADFYYPAEIDPNEQYVACAVDKDLVAVYSLGTGQRVALRQFDGWAQHLAFVPDRDQLLVVTRSVPRFGEEPESIVRLWNFAGGQSPRTLLLPAYDVRTVTVSPDGALAAFTNGNDVRVYRLENLVEEMVRLRPYQNRIVGALAFTPDGRALAAGYYNGDDPARVVFWDTAGTVQFYWTLPQSRSMNDLIMHLRFRPMGQQLVIGTLDNEVYIRDLDLRAVRQSVSRQYRSFAGFQPEQIRAYDLETALSYKDNFDRLANSGDLPLIRSFFDYYVEEAQNTNNTARLKYLSDRAHDLYDKLDADMQANLRDVLLGLLADYHWKLVVAGKAEPAAALVKKIEALSDGSSLPRLAGAHTALIRTDLAGAQQRYAEWTLATFEALSAEEFAEDLGALHRKLLELARYDWLQPAQLEALCGLYGGLLPFSQTMCTEDPSRNLLSGKLARQWQIFRELYRTRSMAGYAEKVRRLENALAVARELADPGYIAMSRRALIGAYGEQAVFEQQSALAVELHRRALALASETPAAEAEHREQIVAHRQQLGAYLRNRGEAAAALVEFQAGRAAAEQLVAHAVAANERQDYSDRYLGPLLLDEAYTLLLVGQNQPARAAIERANAIISYGLNKLYFGHLAFAEGNEAAALSGYANIFTEDQLGLALYDLDVLADAQPTLRPRLLSFTRRLIDSTVVRLAPAQVRTAAQYAGYFRTSRHVTRVMAREDHAGALRWNSAAREHLVAVLTDTAQRYRNTTVYGQLLDTDLAQTFYLLFDGRRDTAAYSRVIALTHESSMLIDSVYPYYRYAETFKTNLAHAYALRNGPGDFQRAVTTYQSYLDLAENRAAVWEILYKDFTDLARAGIYVPGVRQLINAVYPENGLSAEEFRKLEIRN